MAPSPIAAAAAAAAAARNSQLSGSYSGGDTMELVDGAWLANPYSGYAQQMYGSPQGAAQAWGENLGNWSAQGPGGAQGAYVGPLDATYNLQTGEGSGGTLGVPGSSLPTEFQRQPQANYGQTPEWTPQQQSYFQEFQQVPGATQALAKALAARNGGGSESEVPFQPGMSVRDDGSGGAAPAGPTVGGHTAYSGGAGLAPIFPDHPNARPGPNPDYAMSGLGPYRLNAGQRERMDFFNGTGGPSANTPVKRLATARAGGNGYQRRARLVGGFA